MHKHSREFMDQMARQHRDVFAGGRVLEFGSMDINGAARDSFPMVDEWVGVDWRAGKGVDVVDLFHDYESDELFDAFICVSTLEHDPYAEASLQSGFRALREGGLVCLLWDCRGPHEMGSSPREGFYAETTPDELLKLCAELGVSGRASSRGKDVLFVGTRDAVHHDPVLPATERGLGESVSGGGKPDTE